MSRRQLREAIFKLLFRVEFHPASDRKEQEEFFLEEEPMQEKDEMYVRNKYEQVIVLLQEIDQGLEEHSKGWEISRMGKVDLTIMRLAVYEMLYDEEIPNAVAINEAVELAKKFGKEESPSFVNGVLAKFAKEDGVIVD
ncbi:MAG: transcription antitermination factor NusB [Eubacteriales bacterium]